MAEDDHDKTEDPTPKRRGQAKKEGNVVVSQDSFMFANLVAVTLTISFMGDGILEAAIKTIRELWKPRPDFDLHTCIDMLRIAFSTAVDILVPIMTAVVLSTLTVGLLQTRGNISTKKLKPKLKNFSPKKNLSKIFKKQAPIELPKSILKMLAVGGMIWFTISRHIEEYFGLSQLPLYHIVSFILGMIIEAFLAGCIVLLFIALIDYSYQFWQHEKGLKMSKTEVKDERRQSEGDPMIKRRMLSLQYERARAKMMTAVPDADVVVTNPQHLAVALKYDRAEMPSPTVVARGAGILAARIREIATASGVPILENKPLAQTLYRSVKVGQSIPENLFQAVAEVLAFVHRLEPEKERAWQ